MKKRNLATAMAAAMMFGGVAPVVAHANEETPAETNDEVTTNIVEKDNVVDVALANGEKVEVKEYAQIHSNKGTLETKDDELALKEGAKIIKL